MRFTQDIKNHALRHYEEDGWDVVVECYSDAEISEITRFCKTKDGAIRKMKQHIAPYHTRRTEIQAEAF